MTNKSSQLSGTTDHVSHGIAALWSVNNDNVRPRAVITRADQCDIIKAPAPNRSAPLSLLPTVGQTVARTTISR